MNKNKDKDMEIFKKKINNHGYKMTNQRQMIYKTLLEASGEHLNPEEIYLLVKKKDSEIGIATVYRTIKLFEEVGLLKKIIFNDGCIRYEISKKDKDNHHGHHHLLCKNCGKIIEVKVDLLNELEEIIEKKYNFEIHDHSLKFYGLCENCKKKEKN